MLRPVGPAQVSGGLLVDVVEGGRQALQVARHAEGQTHSLTLAMVGVLTEEHHSHLQNSSTARMRK